ncbi:protein GRAVITROPIC IN THE LIGHT 1 [Pistacia vera]|uniref:protein GRAVITROPIC IN THE LIGHT 1 n=1 Tax=Pistacia vera TaxID=55513 RepID=UPI0012630035|nr:protein GRAVITROPIC IN THE LIGHT 1 [Pistacia vera]
MPEIMDGSSAITTTTTAKPPQISEMFQKFALAFKTKTFEFFADEDDHDPSDSEGFALLDSTEDFITDQKVVVIKPDRPHNLRELSPPKSPNLGAKVTETQLVKSEQTHKKSFVNIQMTHTLISSVFATVSSFEASYLQLQTAHVPFVEENIKVADRALVSHLQRLSDFKKFFRDFFKSPDFVDSEEDLAIGSRLEHQVQENQSKLRTLGTVSDRLQEEIDQKDSQVAALRKQLGEIRNCNSKLSKKLSNNLNSSFDVLLTLRVFDSVLHDVCRTTHKFTKILIDLMRKAGWDLDLAANYVYHDINYVKKGHNRYAFLSYVCLGMFRGFDLEGFGFCENDIMCNGHNSECGKSTTSLKQLLEHVSCNPLEMITRDHKCEFSKFCERKYQELIHPTMESSIFSNLDQNEAVLSSWRSLSEFYESFVSMASSIWTLHKLAFSFDPVVEIFQVERGVDFSMVYMEDVTRRSSLMGKARAKVGFTVVPGFKVGRTVIQSQVYICGLKCTE